MGERELGSRRDRTLRRSAIYASRTHRLMRVNLLIDVPILYVGRRRESRREEHRGELDLTSSSPSSLSFHWPPSTTFNNSQRTRTRPHEYRLPSQHLPARTRPAVTSVRIGELDRFQMDGHPSSPSLAKRLRISLERPQPERDPQTGRPQILYDYAEGGAPVWKQSVHRSDPTGPRASPTDEPLVGHPGRNRRRKPSARSSAGYGRKRVASATTLSMISTRPSPSPRRTSETTQRESTSPWPVPVMRRTG